MSRAIGLALSALSVSTLLVIVAAAPVSAQAARQNEVEALRVIAIDNGLIWSGDGEPVAGTLVIRDGRIVAVGPGALVPAGAERIDAAGGIVTAGFVAAGTPLGLIEIDLEDSTRDAAPEGGENAPVDPIRAAFSAADGFHPRSSLIPVARLGGVTSALVTPVGGLIPGTSAWIDLLGDGPDEMLARPVAALHVSLNDSGVSSGGGAMSSALTRLREVLEDARLFARSPAAYDRRGVRELSVSRLDLERIGEALAGRIPVVVRVSRAADITRVLALGREYRFRLVLAGAEEGWRVADEIAAADVPVMVHPLQNLPSSFSRLGTRFDNASLLAAAGVRIILTTAARHGAHDVRKLRQEAGNAVAWGMPRAVALRAVTTEPARVFGMGRDYGQLARGQVANVVVWNGDPFELTTWAVHVFVRGRPAPMTSRQGRLLERYRNLSTVRRGHPGRSDGPAAPSANAESGSIMLSGARCEKCNHSLPLKGELRNFQLPPDDVKCRGCGHLCGTIVPYRVGWMEALLHKVFAIASVPISAYVAFASDYELIWRIGILVGGPVIGGGLGGLILGKLLGLPLTLLRDTRRRRT